MISFHPYKNPMGRYYFLLFQTGELRLRKGEERAIIKLVHDGAQIQTQLSDSGAQTSNNEMIPFFLKMSSTVPSGDPIKGAVAVIPLFAETFQQ